MHEPFFSILMPTRERAHLLELSIQTALWQDFDDFEVVVVDNASTDRTRDIVLAINNPRIRYVRTDKRLSMTDNWEYAFENARGRYVTILCDDDAIRPGLLSRLYDVLQKESTVSVGWEAASYYHADWPDPHWRGRIDIQRFGGGTRGAYSDALLQKMFALEYTHEYPRLLNSCCSRQFLLSRLALMKKLFVPTCPDYSVAVATLTGVEAVLFLDEPFLLFGYARSSNSTCGYDGSQTIRTFMSEFGDTTRIWRIPLSSPTPYNQIAATLVNLKDILPAALAPYELSIVNLFVREKEMIQVCENRGDDTAPMMQAWERAFEKQPESVRHSIERELERLAPKSINCTYATILDAVKGLEHLVHVSLQDKNVSAVTREEKIDLWKRRFLRMRQNPQGLLRSAWARLRNHQ